MYCAFDEWPLIDKIKLYISPSVAYWYWTYILDISLKSLYTKNSSLLRHSLLILNGLTLPMPCIPYAGVCWCLFLLLKVQMSEDYALSVNLNLFFRVCLFWFWFLRIITFPHTLLTLRYVCRDHIPCPVWLRVAWKLVVWLLLYCFEFQCQRLNLQSWLW